MTELHSAQPISRDRRCIAIQGANVHTKDLKGYSPLDYATANGHTAIAEMLLKSDSAAGERSGSGSADRVRQTRGGTGVTVAPVKTYQKQF